jgi:hypothetical protein
MCTEYPHSLEFPLQNTPLFLKRGGGLGGRRKTFFHMEKKFFSSPRFPPALFHAGFVNGEDGGFFPFAFGDFDEGDVAPDVD